MPGERGDMDMWCAGIYRTRRPLLLSLVVGRYCNIAITYPCFISNPFGSYWRRRSGRVLLVCEIRLGGFETTRQGRRRELISSAWMNVVGHRTTAVRSTDRVLCHVIHHFALFLPDFLISSTGIC
jgi:hypothetical protein